MDKLYDFIISRLPDVDGYGACGRVYNDDGISNHNVFKQSIREEVQGDVGVFIITTNENTKQMGHAFYKSEVQIIVNCIKGDIGKALSYLNSVILNIKSKARDDYVWVKACKLVNIAPVGKNSSGIHWCVLNMSLSYIINND